MYQRIREIRTTLENRRKHIYGLFEQTEDEIVALERQIEALQGKADKYESTVAELTEQIKTVNSLLANLGQGGVVTFELENIKDMAQRPGAPTPVEPAPKAEAKAPKPKNKLTFRQVLSLMRGRAFSVTDVYNFALNLPQPIKYSKDSISTQMSTMKREGLLEIYMIREGEGWLWMWKGDKF